MLEQLYLALFRMMLAGSVTALVVLALNLLLRFFKAPRRVCSLLWLAVLFRLLCPASFQSPASLLAIAPVQKALQGSQVVSNPVGDYEVFVEGTPDYNRALGAHLKPLRVPDLPFNYVAATKQDGKYFAAATYGEVYLPWMARGWAAGVLVVAGWGVYASLRLRRRVRFAFKEEAGYYTGERVAAPFVLGLFRPRIYLPLGLERPEQEYILLHEKAHIRHGDHIIKALFFVALCLNWYNALLLLIYKLAVADMEAACDEAVLRELGSEVKPSYCQSLLGFATGHAGLGTPLAFGESDAKERVKQVLRYKRPARWLTACASLAAVALGLFVMADPVEATLTDYYAPMPTYEEQMRNSDSEKMVYLPRYATKPTVPWHAVFGPITDERIFSLMEDAPGAAELPPWFCPVPDAASSWQYFKIGGVYSMLGMDAPAKAQVLCFGGGKVILAGESEHYGTMLLVQMENGYYGLYCNLMELQVRTGSQVKQGDVLGLATGEDAVYFGLVRNGLSVWLSSTQPDPDVYGGGTYYIPTPNLPGPDSPLYILNP